ncbi:NUDIX domain-containing protein [Candidatus Uhrbacteria bacterium]|nr:NUDIX domain-containing protein [Candidatus Uhrbacteria bacterium]
MADIHKTGAIIMSKQDPSKIALIYRSRQDDWTLPKGHVKEGESLMNATMREIAEETGLPVSDAGGELPPIEYDHPKGDHIIVHMFLMQSEDDSQIKPEFEGDKIVWVDSNEVTVRLSYDNIKEYFTSVYETVGQAINDLQSKTR